MSILKIKAPNTLDKMVELSNLKSSPFDGKTWYVEVVPCATLNCDCKNSTLLFRDEHQINTSQYSFYIEGDLAEEKFNELSLNTYDRDLLDLSKPTVLLEEILSEEDWRNLISVHKAAKGAMIDQGDLKKVDAKFPPELFRNPSLAVSFQAIFPLSTNFYLSLDNETAYAISDQYCSNYKCDCTNVCLNFLKNGKEEIFSLWYNYKTGEIDIIDSYKDVLLLKDAYGHLEQLRNKFKGLNKKLEKRNEVMRHLYKNFSMKFNRNMSQGNKRISRKVGRNAPCPCGSGKKYKRCCG